jgi:hypothetical protein
MRASVPKNGVLVIAGAVSNQWNDAAAPWSAAEPRILARQPIVILQPHQATEPDPLPELFDPPPELLLAP